MTGYEVKQSSTAYPLVFLMVDSTGHIAGKTGLTPTVVIRKAGGSFASPSGAVSEVGNGWYEVAGNATDTNTLGPLVLHASATGADPVDVLFPVVAVDPQSATEFIASVPSVTGSVGSVTDPVTIDLTPVVPIDGAANTIADCLNGARVVAFGADSITDNAWTLKNHDGSTAITFTITTDSAGKVTARTTS